MPNFGVVRTAQDEATRSKDWKDPKAKTAPQPVFTGDSLASKLTQVLGPNALKLGFKALRKGGIR